MKPLLEKQLLSRLKFMGLILLFFALTALFFEKLYEDPNEIFLIEEEIETPPPLNPILVSSAFAAVGAACLFIYWKKRKIENNS